MKYPFILEKNEKILFVVFISESEEIIYSMVCKNVDTINKLENELYQEFPSLSENENCFLYKGKILNKFQQFEEIKIKNGDIIIIKS